MGMGYLTIFFYTIQGQNITHKDLRKPSRTLEQGRAIGSNLRGVPDVGYLFIYLFIHLQVYKMDVDLNTYHANMIIAIM